MPVNSSIFAAQKYVFYAHKKYYVYEKSILQKMKFNKLHINKNYITGVFEGDGSLSVNIRKYKNKYILPWFEKTLFFLRLVPAKFDIRICLYADIYSKTFLRVIAYYFNAENPYICSLYPKKNAIVYILRVYEIKIFIQHLKNYPVIANQGRLIVFISDMLKKNCIQSFHISRKIVKAIYLFSNSRKKRKHCIDVVMKDIQNYYDIR